MNQPVEAELAGKPLRRRLRNFRPAVENMLVSAGGPLPYMKRLREIEELTATHFARLAEAYASRGNDWESVAEHWNFEEVNDLIDRHNRYYPIEAHLPMDPRSRDFVKVGGRPYSRKPLDAAWVLERFPA